jgi:hypothetical protein
LYLLLIQKFNGPSQQANDPAVPKSKPKDSQEFNQARAKIRSSKSMHLGLAQYKARADTNELRRVLPALVEHPAYRSLFWPVPVPRSYNLLGGGGIPVQTSFQRELLWCVQTLLPHASMIQEFVVYKRDFEESFLRGNPERTFLALEAVERKFGVSLWLAEATIHYLQTFKSDSAQKGFADSIAVIRCKYQRTAALSPRWGDSFGNGLKKEIKDERTVTLGYGDTALRLGYLLRPIGLAFRDSTSKDEPQQQYWESAARRQFLLCGNNAMPRRRR